MSQSSTPAKALALPPPAARCLPASIGSAKRKIAFWPMMTRAACSRGRFASRRLPLTKVTALPSGSMCTVPPKFSSEQCTLSMPMPLSTIWHVASSDPTTILPSLRKWMSCPDMSGSSCRFTRCGVDESTPSSPSPCSPILESISLRPFSSSSVSRILSSKDRPSCFIISSLASSCSCALAFISASSLVRSEMRFICIWKSTFLDMSPDAAACMLLTSSSFKSASRSSADLKWRSFSSLAWSCASSLIDASSCVASEAASDAARTAASAFCACSKFDFSDVTAVATCFWAASISAISLALRRSFSALSDSPLKASRSPLADINSSRRDSSSFSRVSACFLVSISSARRASASSLACRVAEFASSTWLRSSSRMASTCLRAVSATFDFCAAASSLATFTSISACAA
mmetsp:Transcript_17352/g.44417  ORF Transcript_17352/g.44417 Transcript_17352/m.44417 type:complete len:405 (+) Transcript_17352:2607-3821(+)